MEKGVPMISVEIVNAEKVSAHFKSLPALLRSELAKSMNKLAFDLQAHVKEDKLSGQVLNVRTNRLRSSISKVVTEQTNEISAFVGTNVVYAAIHEYGGQVRTRLGTGKISSKLHGKAFAVMPERSFLRSALEDFRQNIRDELQAAVNRASA